MNKPAFSEEQLFTLGKTAYDKLILHCQTLEVSGFWDQAQQVIAENNVETYWDKTTSQNYGTYDIDNSTYQIWLEDSQSIAEKVKLVSKYNLAGVSAWKLGFENSGIWQVISDNLN